MAFKPPFEHLRPFSKLMVFVFSLLTGIIITLMLNYLVMFIFIGSEGIMEAGSEGLPGMGEQKNMYLVLQLISQLFIFVFPCLFYAILAEKRPLYAVGFRNPRSLIDLFLVGILIYAMQPLFYLVTEWNAGMSFPPALEGVEDWMREKEMQNQGIVESFLAGTSVKSLIANFVVIGIMAAVGEELLFRGVLQNLLQKWWKNKHVAVWLSAFIFSLIHVQFFGFIPRFLMGALFGYLFVWSRSLWLPILAHLLNNGTAVVVAWMAARGSINMDVEEIGSSGSDPLYLIPSILISGFVIWLLWKRRAAYNESIADQ